MKQEYIRIYNLHLSRIPEDVLADIDEKNTIEFVRTDQDNTGLIYPKDKLVDSFRGYINVEVYNDVFILFSYVFKVLVDEEQDNEKIKKMIIDQFNDRKKIYAIIQSMSGIMYNNALLTKEDLQCLQLW